MSALTSGTITSMSLTYPGTGNMLRESKTKIIPNFAFETGTLTPWESYNTYVATKAKRTGDYGALMVASATMVTPPANCTAGLYYPVTLSWCDFDKIEIWVKIPYVYPATASVFEVFINYDD